MSKTSNKNCPQCKKELTLWSKGYFFEGLEFCGYKCRDIVEKKAQAKQDEKAAQESAIRSEKEAKRIQKLREKWEKQEIKQAELRERLQEEATRFRKKRDQDAPLLAKAKQPNLSVLDSAQIAIRVTKKTPLEELGPVLSIIEGEKDIEKILQDANERLTSDYTEEIKALYKDKEIEFDAPFFDVQLKTDLDQCMSLGLNSIKQAMGIKIVSKASSDSSPQVADSSSEIADGAAGRKIKKTKSWKEIKKNLK